MGGGGLPSPLARIRRVAPEKIGRVVTETVLIVFRAEQRRRDEVHATRVGDDGRIRHEEGVPT